MMFKGLQAVRSPSLSANDRRGGPIRLSVPKDDPPDFELTDDQKAAVDALHNFVISPEPAFLLSGYAGTGKTTVLSYWLRQTKFKIALTAPTNKAVRVLRETAGAHGLAVDCLTIFKMLDLKLADDREEKYTKKNYGKLPRMDEFDLVVIDECSMVGNRQPPGKNEIGLYDRIMQEAEDLNVKIVFVGDPAQLPPVKEGESPTFETGPRFELRHVVRQAEGNPILQVATYLRQRMFDPSTPMPDFDKIEGLGVHAVEDYSTYQRAVIDAFRDDPQDGTAVKALAWRNKTVDHLNAHVRRAVLGEDLPLYQAGERYVATQPVIRFDGSQVSIDLATDDDALITAREPTTHPQFRDYKMLRLDLETDDGEEFPCVVVDPSDEKKWERDLNELGARCKRREDSWRRFWQMHDAVSHLKPHYVMTTHRSQGSTYENVFVDASDILANRNVWEANRCLYVACTRASQNLYVFG